MKKFIFLIILIFLICLVFTGCKKGDLSNHPEDFDRFVFVEKYWNYGIMYDKFSNVMYFYGRDGHVTPIYNADGSLYLYTQPMTVG